MTRHFFASTLALLFLSACATTGSSPVASGSGERSAQSQLFADYLIGSYANDIDDAQARSKHFAKAYNLEGQNKQLGRVALTSAITAGQEKLAENIAKDLILKHEDAAMARAFLGAKAYAAGRSEQAIELFSQPTTDLTTKNLMDLMQGWAQVDAGDNEAAEKLFTSLQGGSYFALLGQMQLAKLESASGAYEAAEDRLETLSQTGLSPIEAHLTRARNFSHAGQVEKAADLLNAFADENGGFEAGPVRQYLDRVNAGKPIGIKLNSREEASRALTETSFGFFVRNRINDPAEIYLRFALKLDPNNDKAKLWLGSLLEDSGRDAEAMELFQDVPDSSPYTVSAHLSQANVHFQRDEDAKAIKILEEVNEKHTSFITRESLGRARLIRENYAEALPIYDALVNSMSDETLKANVEPLYFRGICYERTDQWAEAEADFLRVLEIDPDNADALNYLGYTWVDRNENLTRAFDMIRKAVKLEPQSGAIVDSLGWAHYKLGQYSQAKINLEKAVELSPSSATIIDHLGDVYWKLGRYREAGYQWSRALDFDPTDEERDNIQKKLKGGLEAVKKSS